jgi:hypothetical protein
MSNSMRGIKSRLSKRLDKLRKRNNLVFQLTLVVGSGCLLTLVANKIGGQTVWSCVLGDAAPKA